MLKINFSERQQNLRGNKNIWGALTPNSPRGHGPSPSSIARNPTKALPGNSECFLLRHQLFSSRRYFLGEVFDHCQELLRCLAGVFLQKRTIVLCRLRFGVIPLTGEAHFKTVQVFLLSHLKNVVRTWSRGKASSARGLCNPPPPEKQ